jgi:Transglutaminase-like superfamily
MIKILVKLRKTLAWVVPIFLLLALGISFAEPPKNPRFTALEKHALSAKSADEKDFATLAAFLVSKAKGDKEKAWCIYRWVTDRLAYNVEAFLEKKPGDNSVETVLKTRLCVCEGYSRIFLKLCQETGLEAIKVTGVARSGSKDTKGKPAFESHAWNAVKLDGKWELIDSTFGSGSVDKKAFVKNFEPMFFMVPPEQMRFTHFPEDAKWQLLEKTITREDFDKQPLVQASLFKLGLSPASILKTTKSSSFGGFPEIFDVAKTKIKVVEVPLNAKLKTGQIYRIAIESPELSKVLILSNDKPQMNLQKQGSSFTGEVRALSGTMLIAVQKPNQGNEYSFLLRYKVE